MTAARTFPSQRCLVIVSFCALLSLAAGIRNAWQQPVDLRLRYQTARLMLAGENPHRLKLPEDLSPRAQAALGGTVMDFAPDYLPSAMLPMLPLAWLPWWAAKLAWLVVNLASAGLLMFLVRRWADAAAIPRTLFWMAVALWIAGTPFRNNLGAGQNTVFALALTLAAVPLQQRNRYLLAGGLLALGLFKYAYVGLVVVFFIALNRGWRTLLVAGSIHLVTHLLLCLRMNVHPLGIIGEVFQDNSRIFNRETTLTVWLPFRALAAQFPHWHLPADLLGAGALGAVLLGLFLVWRRQGLSPHEHAWAFVLCLLATLVVTCRNYHLVFCLFGWLWIFSPAAALPAARVPRLLLAGALAYLTLVHRLVQALAARMPGEYQPWLLWAFNAGLLTMCLASAVLFWKSVGKPSASPGAKCG